MPRKQESTKASTSQGTGANVGYQADPWRMADAFRGSMDEAEDKHVMLGESSHRCGT